MSKFFAKKLLEDVVRMTSEAKTSHVGGCLSCLDVVSVLFTKILNIDKKNPKSKKRDRFILSKGHTAAIIYSALANKGFFPKKWLSTFIQNGTKFLYKFTLFTMLKTFLISASIIASFWISIF